MNCIDYRRQYTTDPNNSDPELIAHRESCKECADFTVRMQSFETDLADAANIEIPKGLESRIMLHTLHHAQKHKKQQRLYAIAASVVFALGLFVFLSPPTNRSLDEIVLAHINDEKDHLYFKNNVQLAKLNNVLQPFGKHLDRPIGQVNYAGTCEIHNNAGAHLVLQGKAGPVTVMIMPAEKLGKRKTIHNKDFNGILLPIGKHGSMAIVGQHDEALDSIEQQLVNALVVGQG